VTAPATISLAMRLAPWMRNFGLTAALIALAPDGQRAGPLHPGAASRGASSASAYTDVSFSINTSITHPVSRFIYGMNFLTDAGARFDHASAPWYGAVPPAGITLNRMGGNRMSAYNWVTNYSNAGSDYKFSNDEYLAASNSPGEAVRVRVAAAFERGAAMLVTVPMLGYVAGDKAGPLDDLDADRATRLAAHFKVSAPTKGRPFTLTPDPKGPSVYQDEFVNWLNATFPHAQADSVRAIFYSLDNEPDDWHQTHSEIQSNYHDDKSTPRLQTYDGFIDTTILYARAIKSVAPKALVFGPTVATYAGVLTLGRYPSPDPVYGTRSFCDVYLDRLRQAEQTYGHRLLDVLDVHWFPAAGTQAGDITNDFATQDAGMIRARLQAPRSLWDSSYVEGSWVNKTLSGPIQLLPRLRSEIAAHYPGTKLAITEYYYGRAGDIVGGVTQADVLGVFGREGVFAATMWPQANVWAPPFGGNGALAYAYAFGAFDMYVNYDNAGGRFGDLGVAATTSDPVGTSVYASLDSARRVVIVAINKQYLPQRAVISLRDSVARHSAQVYAIFDGVPTPKRQPDVAIAPGNAFTYTLPPMSVTDFVLAP